MITEEGAKVKPSGLIQTELIETGMLTFVLVGSAVELPGNTITVFCRISLGLVAMRVG
jgi:hypothetical protein